MSASLELPSAASIAPPVALPPTSLPPTLLPPEWSVADLIEKLDIPAARIHILPAPGTATEADVQRIADHEDRLFELIDGVLVEKAMGLDEAELAVLIAHFLHSYLETHGRGHVYDADAAMRILGRQIRIPDVSFVSTERRGRGKLAPIPALVPNLAVEVLSATNTTKEMERKLHEYFEAGVELVWYVDPETKSARLFTSPTEVVTIDESGALDGGRVLPGLKIPLRELFARTAADESPE